MAIHYLYDMLVTIGEEANELPTPNAPPDGSKDRVHFEDTTVKDNSFGSDFSDTASTMSSDSVCSLDTDFSGNSFSLENVRKQLPFNKFLRMSYVQAIYIGNEKYLSLTLCFYTYLYVYTTTPSMIRYYT